MPLQVDLAGDVGVVLDHHRHAEQRALVARAAAAGGLVGLGERALGEHDAERVELRVDPRHPLEVELDQLARRDLAGAQSSSAWRAIPAKARSAASMARDRDAVACRAA